MGSPFNRFIRKKQIMLCRFSVILIVSYFGHRIRYLCSDLPPSLETPSPVESATQILPLIKHMCLQQNADTSMATSEFANDFGNMTRYDQPLAVLSPSSTSDISCILRFINEASSLPFTVAARGSGHSLQGQAQAPNGVVISMVSLRAMVIQVHAGEQPYADVHGGHLWIDVLTETLKYGLTPRSWTDYLHLTIGGTLSAAGVSGQAFWHGPQISNVHQMEVVTGKGEVFNCSENQNADLFYAVLGGLGQFGIITRARIPLQAAPKMVKWIRATYSDFSTFSKDQEHLISLSPKKAFEYVEGFVKINASENNCKYVLEVVKHINPEDSDRIKQIVDGSLSTLSYIPSTLAIKEVKYVDFLDRVHASEVKLQAQGRWKVPHPWLNLLVPRSKIQAFAEGVFSDIVQDSSSGPIIIYPVNKTKWSNRTSVVAPDEDVFYKVSFLFSAVTHPTGEDVIESLLNQNKRILEFCEAAKLGVKQYMPHYTTRSEWEAHFGPHWEVFRRRKLTYDPLAILAPGQLIFPRKATLMS